MTSVIKPFYPHPFDLSKAVRLQPRTQDLKNALLQDLGAQVAIGRATVTRRSLELLAKSPHHGKMGSLYGLQGVRQLHFVIRDEEYANQLTKIIYGWKNESDLGELYCVRSIHAVCQRANSGSWQPLAKTIPLKLSRHQERRRSLRAFRDALAKGLGRQRLFLEFTVSPYIRNEQLIDGRVAYRLSNGRLVEIYGFKGHKKVGTMLREENNSLLAYFNSREKQLIKTAVVSIKKVDSWQPLAKPLIIYAQGERSTQRKRVPKNIEVFLAKTQEK